MRNLKKEKGKMPDAPAGTARCRDHSLPITGVVLLVIVFFLVVAFSRINVSLRRHALERMSEGAETVAEEVLAKLDRDSRLLNAAATIISQVNNYEMQAMLDVMAGMAPLVETMQINVLMADGRVLSSDGTVYAPDPSSGLSFEEEAAQGEHVSGRMLSLSRDSYMLRHFVPIVQNGRTAALLYGVTYLNSLPGLMNLDNIYNANAEVFIIDTETGDFLMDSLEDPLGNLSDFGVLEVRGGETWENVERKITELQTGYVNYFSPRLREWCYLYYAPAGINRWTIFVSVPDSEAFAGVYDVQQVWLVLAAALAVVVFGYYLWVRRNAKRVTEQAVNQAVLQEKLQKAEAADRAKSTFLTNMSHDIRTPMNAIIGFATLAETNLERPERVKEYLKKILTAGNHLLSLINDILDMSRIESGKLNIVEKPCAISDIFSDMRDIIHDQMQSKQLNFCMDAVDVVNENIYCDKLHINQVLLNLLSNAIKFTPEGGTVTVTMRQLPQAPAGRGAYEIRVKDTGIGMSREFVTHIFEPFERERTSTISGIQGTGLGMAITKNIVDAMGGSIEVETEQGRGTEFIIRLNFRVQAAPEREETVREFAGLRALVVDDSFSTCDSVTKMLRRMGIRSEWTMHGKEAVLRARQAREMGDPYRVYVVDWVIPDLSGQETVRRIHAEAGDSALIIVATAYDFALFEQEARAAGAAAFCNKPVFQSELREILLSASREGQKAASVPGPEKERFDGIRLLVVEDNELNRDIAVELLTQIGFQVETAEDGSVAVDKVARSAPGYYALILMDIQMPVMNGYEATRQIRALENPALREIPIIAMTADAFEDDRTRALQSGMNAHVAKPVDINKMVNVISEILRQ